MREITTIQEAEDYIFNYNWYASKSGNQEEEYKRLKDAEQFGIASGNKKLICLSRAYLASYYNHNNELQLALDMGKSNLQFAKEERLENEIFKILPFLAETYQSLGDISGAEEIVNQWLEILPTINDKLKLSRIHDIIAAQYFFTQDKERCLQTINISLQYAKEVNDKLLLANIYNNYSFYLLKYNLFSEALENLKLGFEIVKNTSNDYFKAVYYKNFGTIYLNLGEFRLAKSYFNKSIRLYNKLVLKNELNELQTELCRTYIECGQYTKALGVLKSLEENCIESSSNKVLREVYKLFNEVYTIRHNYKKAHYYLSKYMETNSLIYNEESNKKIRDLQIINEVNAINKQRINAERLAKVKHDFLATMSHEIRTPINSILGICYLMKRDDLQPKQLEFIERLNKSGENLLNIINDVLDVSKIEAGKIELSAVPVQINDVIRDVYDMLIAKAQQKQIDIQLDLSDALHVVSADRVRVEQVLMNLCSNAIKFTNDGAVTIHSSVLDDSADKQVIKIRISDSGIGIHQSKLQTIFNEYEQESGKTFATYGGTGLGLSISKKLVELMQGTIAVKSEVNVGTEFIVTIPFSKAVPEKAKVKKTDHLDKAMNGKIIYIADDMIENRTVLKEILLQLNNTLQISEADSGSEVLGLVAKRLPDILFIDLDMPGMNGFETAEQIRNNYPAHRINVIAHSASLLTITLDELKSYGFSEFLPKPFKVEQLVQKIIPA